MRTGLRGNRWNDGLFGFMACALLFGLCTTVAAQQREKVPRIGLLGATYPHNNTARIEAFRQGLRDLGYIEKDNILIEYRWAEGKAERVPELTADLLRLRVDVIVTAGPAVIRPVKEATSTIPIVMAFDNDPVGSGFVSTLARPGGNITGLSVLFPQLRGKRLEILKETLPVLSRMAIFGTSKQPGTAQTLKATELAADAFGVQVLYQDVREPNDIDGGFQAARKARADAALVLSSAVFFSQRARIADLAVKNRLPIIFPQNEFVEDGGLMSYAPNYADLFRRAATYWIRFSGARSPRTCP